MKFFFLILFSFFFSLVSFVRILFVTPQVPAQNHTVNRSVLGNYISYTLNGNVLTIHTDNSDVQIIPYDEKMFKITLLPGAIVNPDSSFSVIMKPTNVSTQLDDQSNYLEFSSGNFKMHAEKFPLRMSFINGNETLLQDEQGLYSSSGSSGVGFKLNSDEHIYGTGSRAIDVDRRGKFLTSYNIAQYGYSNGASQLNINIPFIISSKMYGLFIDNYSPGTWDIGNSNPGVLNYTSESGKFSYFVIAGNSNEEILDEYTDLTGKQPLPPRWALGYIQSKYGYQTETDARNIVNLMVSKNFPLDALVLDLYWYGDPSKMGNLNWDYSRFPTPRDMMHDFDSMGIKTICITEPYLTQASSNFSYTSSNHLLATDAFGESYVLNGFWAGNAGLLDMFSTAAQNWMWSYYDARIAEGVGGWWLDLGEPEDHPDDMMHSIGDARTVHNVYSLIWSQLLFQKYQQFHPQTRLFNLIRSGYAGMQRYGCVTWSGDIQSSFDGMKAQIPIMLGMSMSGVGYMHSDLGGFTGGEDDELYTRWLEFGSFCPIMRAHGAGVTEPVYYSTATQNIVRKFSQLRHQLTPYNYSLAYENSTTGIPLARPVNFYDPQNEILSNINDEYLWGENFLVAPEMNEGATSRNVTFPTGKWINYWTNQMVNGNSTITVSATIDVMPLFVKAGSFIPMVPLINSLANYNTDTLLVKYFADTSVALSSFDIYDDDGKDPLALANGDYDLIHLEGNASSEETDITLSKSGNSFASAPLIREMNFQLQRISKAPVEVLENSFQLPITSSLNDFNAKDSAAYFDQTTQVLYVHFKWRGTSTMVRILYNETGIGYVKNAEAKDFILFDPMPNPFSTSIIIPFEIYAEGNYTIQISNTAGKGIKMISLRNIRIGKNQIVWNGKDDADHAISSGEYVITMKGKNDAVAKKIVKVQ